MSISFTYVIDSICVRSGNVATAGSHGDTCDPATFFRPLGRIFHPGRIVRGIGSAFGGDHVQPAANLNALDEAPNSSWFTNRIGLFPMTPEQVARGPIMEAGPDTSSTWTVVDAKTEGVTPGFTIDLQQKDLRLVLDAADELGAPLPGTSLVFQMYRALQRRGLGSDGNHALVKALEEMSGLVLAADGPA